MTTKDVPAIQLPPEGSESEAKKQAALDPKEADKVAEQEYKSKYPGFGKRPSGLAQRKISSTGGKQYFDSGEYNRSASVKAKHEMASLPHAMDPKSIHSHPTPIPPHLARMKAKPRAPTSGLAGPASTKSPLSN